MTDGPGRHDAQRKPRILCVGAYERDNFGDLLFQIVTDQYLQGADVIYAAPFAADMTSITGLDIPAFGPLLESESFDAIWTVGGEVGGTSVPYAYKLARGAAEFRSFRTASPERRREILAEQMGTVVVESPYLPRASAYPKNVGAAAIVNSVGVATLQGLPPERRAAVTGILREAARVSVRDLLSSVVLAEAGIAHTLDPDLVHTIALSRPRPDGAPRGDYALLQISSAHLRKHSLAAYADAIIESRSLAERPVRLFLAGTAHSHDSSEAYERIRDRVLAADPERRIELSTTIRPWDRVDEIAGAALWLGGSLHGRIVACAYGVPRASLAKRKLDRYAETWDPDMPWGVTPETMDAAVRAALRAGPKDRCGAELAALADANMRAAVATAFAHRGSPPAEDGLLAIIEVRNRQWEDLTLGLANERAGRRPVPTRPPGRRRRPSLWRFEFRLRRAATRARLALRRRRTSGVGRTSAVRPPIDR